jgi:type IV pilus assembly protein PilM
MASSNSCWGIEIGAFAIKAVKVEGEPGSVRATDLAVIPHAKVLSTPDIEVADVVRVSLGTLVSQYDLSNSQIAVSVPGASAFARFAKLPPVSPKDVPNLVNFEAQQQIPFPLDEVEWDYQTFVTKDSPEVEVGIFAITKDKIAERLATLADANVSPDYLTISPIAAYNALAYDLGFDESMPGTIIADVGTTSTDLIIAEPGRIWIRTFPLGGHHFTQALVDAYKLEYAKAERVKIEGQEGRNWEAAAKAMRSVFTDLAQDIQRSIGYYQSLHSDAKLERLIGVGSTFHIPGLRKYLKQQIGVEVYRVEELKKLSDSGLSDERKAILKDNSLNLVTAYGLALRGLEMQTIKADLMPVTVVREAMWKKKTKWFGLAAGLGVAAGAAMFIRPAIDHLAVSNMEKPAIIDQAIAAANEQKKKAQDAGVIGGATSDLRAANMAALLDHRQIYAHIVDDLGLIMEDANAKAATGATNSPHRGYALKSFNTRYLAPGQGLGDDGSNPGGRPAQAAGSMKQPRVVITLRLATTQSDPQAFANETVERWLKENRKRDGIPYVLESRPTPWRVERVADAGDPAAAARPVDDPDGGGGGKGSGLSRRQPPPVTPPPGARLVGGANDPASDAKSLASLDEFKLNGPPTTAIVTVEWTAVINTPDAKEGGK